MPHQVEIDDVPGAFTEPMGFDVFTTTDEEIWTLLETASAENDSETVQEIIQLKKLRPVGYFTTGAIVAIENDHLNMVATFLQAGLPVGESLIRAALDSTKKYDYLQLFVAAGWDIDTPLNPHTPSVLALAAKANDLLLVQWLLQERSADVNIECNQLHTPLSVALQHSEEAIVDAMMKQNVRIEKGQLMHYALWRALKQPRWDSRLMDSLLAKGAPINNKMYDSEEESETIHQMSAIPFGTPLHIAVEAESIVAVKYLLQHGARADAEDEDKRTPLDIATGEISQLLQGC